MRRQLAWIMRGADRTQDAFDDHGTDAIRDLQRHVDELRSTVTRLDADAARIGDASQGLTARLDHLSQRIDQLGDRRSDRRHRERAGQGRRRADAATDIRLRHGGRLRLGRCQIWPSFEQQPALRRRVRHPIVGG